MIHSNTIDFKQDFGIVKDYKYGDKVSRENFISFLILSYELSRGQPEIQKVFFVWHEKLVQFKHWENLETFVRNGGYYALKTKEQEHFYDAFRRIEKHKQVFSNADELEIEMKNSLLKLRGMYNMSDDFLMLTNRAMDYFHFPELKSFDDFRAAAAKYVKAKYGV